MKTVTKTIKAWITPHRPISPKDLAEGRIGGLYYSDLNMVSEGWTLAGEATITVNLVDEKELINNKVESLREQAKSIRAEATAKCTQIESQIQNLLAITYDEQVKS